MHYLNLSTSAKPVMTKLQTLLIKLVDTEIFQLKPKLNLFIADVCKVDAHYLHALRVVVYHSLPQWRINIVKFWTRVHPLGPIFFIQ